MPLCVTAENHFVHVVKVL